MFYKLKRVVEEGPNGASYYFKNSDGDVKAIELAEVEGWHYVWVPAGTDLPEQHPEIQFQTVIVDDVLKEQIKSNSRAVALIEQEIQVKIREKYSLEDEQYFARIGVGVALGLYTFEAGEQQQLIDFGTFVEGIRLWGRVERNKLGL